MNTLKSIQNHHWEKIGTKLPKRKEVSFPKEDRKWLNCEYVDCEFGNFVVRGLEEDIDYLLNKFSDYFKPSDKECVIDGIFDLKGFALGCTIPDILNLIKEVPSVMIVGFFEDWSVYQTKIFYSKSGYPYITDMDWVCSFDSESELNRPTLEIYPTQSMSAKFRHLQTGIAMEVDYEFADYICSVDWEDFTFVTCLDGVYYALKKD